MATQAPGLLSSAMAINPQSKEAQMGAQARPYAQGTPASVEDVTKLYEDLLGRTPDQGGLDFYVSSNFSPEQIAAEIKKSAEYAGYSRRPTTLPPATQPPATQPPATQPPATQPPANPPPAERDDSVVEDPPPPPPPAQGGAVTDAKPIGQATVVPGSLTDRTVPTGGTAPKPVGSATFTKPAQPAAPTATSGGLKGVTQGNMPINLVSGTPAPGDAYAAVVVYGPDGTMYPSPAAALAAGVTNYTLTPPVKTAPPSTGATVTGGGLISEANNPMAAAFSGPPPGIQNGLIGNPFAPGGVGVYLPFGVTNQNPGVKNLTPGGG